MAKEKKKMKNLIEIEKSPKTTLLSSSEETPIRPIVCLKRKIDLKAFDDAYDCFILDFEQSEPPSKRTPLDDDLSVIAEKGQVACRDFPHSRHLCIKYPFNSSSHEKFCKLCYCYVCDLAAPCRSWKSHCDAYEKVDAWESLKAKVKK